MGGKSMNFTLTKEQELVRQMVRDFAVNEVKPIAAEIKGCHLYALNNHCSSTFSPIIQIITFIKQVIINKKTTTFNERRIALITILDS